MPILRSFDANRPGTPVRDILGGIVGGSATQGLFKVGEEIEISPGIRVDKKANRSMNLFIPRFLVYSLEAFS